MCHGRTCCAERASHISTSSDSVLRLIYRCVVSIASLLETHGPCCRTFDAFTIVYMCCVFAQVLPNGGYLQDYFSMSGVKSLISLFF